MDVHKDLLLCEPAISPTPGACSSCVLRFNVTWQTGKATAPATQSGRHSEDIVQSVVGVCTLLVENRHVLRSDALIRSRVSERSLFAKLC